MSPLAPVSQTVDIRTLGGCTLRKARVLETFDGLDEGESLLVVNDHLPKGLLLHFEDQRPGRFQWTPMEEGPEVFSVLITKRASAQPSPTPRDPADG